MPYESLLAYIPAVLLGLGALGLFLHRSRILESAHTHRELVIARAQGSDKARLLHPEIDLDKCLGCGACIEACPENGVLSLLHGQVAVVHGSRCVGHGECATSCPTGAIALTLGDLTGRRDLPALERDFSVVGVPGLFLAGELSGYALVRTAVSQGVAVADKVMSRLAAERELQRRSLPIFKPETIDLLIVGAGPAGLACALRATELGIRYRIIEQESQIGGTIAAYPRKKLVMTQPLHLPLHGRLGKTNYEKEELIDIWEALVTEHKLPISTGVKLNDLTTAADGTFIATTSDGTIQSRNVCLALGRRGTPRRLGIPGEDLSKVSYSLIDAASYDHHRILIVGGGDSAIEAALALAQQPGNVVTLSYRKSRFTRIRSRNDLRITEAIHRGQVQAHFDSEVQAIEPAIVQLKLGDGQVTSIANDEVFIFAGGEPPFPLLERAGVSMDPADHPRAPAVVERGDDLLGVLLVAFICSIVIVVWASWFHSYYAVPPSARPTLSEHALLRPTGPVGMASGIGACVMFAANLLYLVRRSPRWGSWFPGSLRVWLAAHVLTGMAAVLLLFVHAGFTIRPTVGGHAMIALGLVILSGSIGRYLYAQIPRAANGREVNLTDIRAELAAISAQWDTDGAGFGTEVRQQVDDLIIQGPWRSSLVGRIGLLVAGHFRLRRCLSRLRAIGRSQGVPEDEIRHMQLLARRANRLAIVLVHYQELGAVLATWRYFHGWLGFLMVGLAVVHIVTATRYSGVGLEWLTHLFSWVSG